MILRMMDKENAYIAKVFSYFSVQNIGGKKVTRPRNKELATAGPINSVLQSSQLKLDGKLSYPSVLSTVVANMEGAKGKYTIQIYTKDKGMAIEKM